MGLRTWKGRGGEGRGGEGGEGRGRGGGGEGEGRRGGGEEEGRKVINRSHFRRTRHSSSVWELDYNWCGPGPVCPPVSQQGRVVREKQRSVLPTVSRLQAGTVHQILGEGRGGERKGGGEGEGGEGGEGE